MTHEAGFSITWDQNGCDVWISHGQKHGNQKNRLKLKTIFQF